MKPKLALLLFTMCAAGCAPKPCRQDTVYLTLEYAGAASSADSVTLDVTVGGSQQGYTRSRTPGALRDALEIDFRAYPQAATVVIAATATKAGQAIGSGLAQSTLAAGCTAVTLAVGATAPPSDAGAPDLAVARDDLAGADLAGADLAASSSGDLAVASGGDLATGSSADLAVASGGDLAAGSSGDLAVALGADFAVAAAVDLASPPPPHDLASPSSPDLASPSSPDLAKAPVVDLAMPVAPPDLAQPIVDLAQTPVLAFSGESDTAQMPNNQTNTVYTDACPAGQAMVGFALAVATDSSGSQLGINRADTICGLPAAQPATGGGWTVTWTAGATLPGHGTTDQALVVYQCNSNGFLVGFGGRSGAYYDKMLLSCAPILIDASLDVSVGATVDSNTGVGGSGGSAFANIYCPAGQVATIARTRDLASSPPNAFGYGCSTPVLVK